MIITPSLSLLYCPRCSEKLDIEPMFSHKETSCSKCGYTEPAGSAHFVTFVSEVLTQFMRNLGIEEVTIGDASTKDLRGAVDAQAILPALVVNAKLNTKTIGKGFNNIPLTTVQDKNAFYQRRVITNSNNISNPSIAISTLSETLYSAHQMSINLSPNKTKKIIDLNLLSPISASQQSSISEYTINEMGISQNAQQMEVR